VLGGAAVGGLCASATCQENGKVARKVIDNKEVLVLTRELKPIIIHPLIYCSTD
jgi:hypothetical protein